MIRRFAKDDMFTFRNVVSEVTAGFLDQTMMWAVGNLLQGQGTGPMSEREMWGVFRADAQARCGCSCMCLDEWMKAVAMDEIPVGGKD